MGIDGRGLENGLNFFWEENEYHHRVQRPRISIVNTAIFQLDKDSKIKIQMFRSISQLAMSDHNIK